jgi:hypothetical protein
MLQRGFDRTPQHVIKRYDLFLAVPLDVFLEGFGFRRLARFPRVRPEIGA